MSKSYVRVVRRGSALVAWLSGIAAGLGLVPLLVIGIPTLGNDTDCGTVFGPQWRPNSPYCHHRMLTFAGWELALLVLAVAAGLLWWTAYKADDPL